MRPFMIVGCFVLLTLAGLGQSTNSITASDKAALDNITSRVRTGNYNALNEAATMPASIAVPYLQSWTAPRNGPQLSKAAGEAISNVSGYADYFRQDMANIVAQGRIPGDDFIALASIGTPEAAAVAAPYLFDGRLISVNQGEPPDSIDGWAETILEQMRLPDAPKLDPTTPSSAALIAWQKWAIAKSFVPQSWNSKVGAPAWMLRMDAWKPPAPATLAAKSPQQLTQTAVPSPSITPSSSVPSNTPSQSPSAASSVIEITSSKSTLPIWGSVVLVLLVIGGVVMVLRKRP